MPTVNPSPFGPKPQFELSSGLPAVGNKLFFYAAGSSTKQNTYTDSAGTVANTNPLILNSLGEPSTQIWFTAGQSYKVVYAPSTDTDPPSSPIWTIDNLSGINDTTVGQDQWISSALTPTFINTTQFSVAGDQTLTLHVGRRIKATVTAGTVYGTITASAFASVTTITLQLDGAQVLDSGLSSFSYGLLSSTNVSLPFVNDALSTVASATTPNIWGTTKNISYTGTATATGFSTAPQAGATRTLVCAAAAVFTAGANMLIDGVTSGSSYTATAGEQINVIAVTTSQFRLVPMKARGWVLLAQQTASSSATIDFTANSGGLGFDDTYDKYMVAFDQIKPATDNVYLAVRIGTGAGPTFQSGAGAYGWGLSYVGVGGTPAGEGSTGTGIATLIALTPTGGNGVGNAAGEHITGVVEYSNPDLSDFPTFLARAAWLNASTLAVNSQASGNYGSAAAITGVRFLFSSGNIASGTFRLYGLRK